MTTGGKRSCADYEAVPLSAKLPCPSTDDYDPSMLMSTQLPEVPADIYEVSTLDCNVGYDIANPFGTIGCGVGDEIGADALLSNIKAGLVQDTNAMLANMRNGKTDQMILDGLDDVAKASCRRTLNSVARDMGTTGKRLTNLLDSTVKLSGYRCMVCKRSAARQPTFKTHKGTTYVMQRCNFCSATVKMPFTRTFIDHKSVIHVVPVLCDMYRLVIPRAT